jgi:hypothetical protein
LNADLTLTTLVKIHQHTECYCVAQSKRDRQAGKARLLVITIIRVRMIMYTAFTIIGKVSCNDEDNRRDQQPGIVMNKKQLYDQKNHTYAEQDERPLVMMMFLVSVVKRIRTDTKSKQYHKSLKDHVMDDIYAKQRKG